MIRASAFLHVSIGLAIGDSSAQDFKSSVATLGEKARGKWALAKAQVDTKILSDRNYKFTVVPREMNGAALVIRNSDDLAYWLSPKSVFAKKDGTAFAIIRTKYNIKEVVGPGVLKKLKDDG